MRCLKITLTALLLITFSDSWGQSETGFIISKGALLWQKKYENHSSSDMIELFRESGLMEKSEAGKISISGILKPFEPDFSTSGYRGNMIPGYLAGIRITGFMNVDVNGHGYVVTIRDIKLIRIMDKSRSALDTYALKGSVFNMEFSKTTSSIISHCFEKRLGIVTTEDKF